MYLHGFISSAHKLAFFFHMFLDLSYSLFGIMIRIQNNQVLTLFGSIQSFVNYPESESRPRSGSESQSQSGSAVYLLTVEHLLIVVAQNIEVEVEVEADTRVH